MLVVADFEETADFDLMSAVASDGWLVLPCDGLHRKAVPGLEQHRERVLCFGRAGGCDIAATDIAFADGCLRFRTEQQWFQAPAWSRSSLKEVLAAVAVGRIFGVPLAQAAERLAHSQPSGGPRQVVQGREVTIVHDSAAATPTSLGKALDLLRKFPAAGRRIVCAGDLSDGSQADHLESVCRDFGSEIVTRCGADASIAFGATAGHVTEAARAAGLGAARAVLCRGAHEASSRLAAMLSENDVLLLVGGQAEIMSQIIESVRFQASGRGLQAAAV